MPNQPTLEDLINLTFEKCELISEKDEINSANDGKEIKPMPNQSDMKVIVTLTKEQFDLFKSMGQIIDNEYFNLPQYFKCIGEGKFEVLNFNQLPDYVKEDLLDTLPKGVIPIGNNGNYIDVGVIREEVKRLKAFGFTTPELLELFIKSAENQNFTSDSVKEDLKDII